MTDEKKNELKMLVQTLTSEPIGNENPKGFCFSTSFALSIYLDAFGYQNSIAEGNFNCAHYWLNLKGYDNIIIDATIRQFDIKQDPIYIGKIGENEITKQYKITYSSFNDWVQLYQIWCNPKYNTIGEQRPTDIYQKLLLHNLATASILNYEIQNLDSDTKLRTTKSYLYKLYFQPIIQMVKLSLCSDNEIISLVRSKVGNKFDLLLLKVV
jgi:hypothetical protein